MIRVTLDTNEYVSALNFRGAPLEFLRLAIDGDLEIAISAPIIDETVKVLREKFEWPPYDLHDARQRLQKIACIVKPKERLAVLADDPDNRILECAVEAESEYIITEDRVMLRLKQYGNAQIVTAEQFLEIFRGG